MPFATRRHGALAGFADHAACAPLRHRARNRASIALINRANSFRAPAALEEYRHAAIAQTRVYSDIMRTALAARGA